MLVILADSPISVSTSGSSSSASMCGSLYRSSGRLPINGALGDGSGADCSDTDGDDKGESDATRRKKTLEWLEVRVGTDPGDMTAPPATRALGELKAGKCMVLLSRLMTGDMASGA